MRKILSLLLLIWGASVLDAAPTMPPSPNDFQYSADLEGPIKQGILYQGRLSSDVLQKCASDYRDVRLFGPGDKEVPFVILENEYPNEVIETYPLEIIGYVEAADSVVITVKVPDKHLPVSLIDLGITDSDFKKKVVLHGSYDRKKWDALAEEVIYDFSSQVDLRKTTVEFAKADYRFYRIELINTRKSAGSDKSTTLKYEALDFTVNGIQDKKLRINKVDGKTGSTKERTAIHDAKIFTNFSSSLDEAHKTVIILEAALPFDKIFLEISNPYYYRSISLYHSDTGEKNSYRLLTQNSIYSFPLSGLLETKNYIGYKSSKHGYYKFVIDNRNSPPLEIKSIRFEWIQKNLYFIALDDAEKYTLCLGNNIVNRPDYDLSTFIDQNNWFRQKFVNLKTGSVRQNATYTPKTPLDKKARAEKFILTIVVTILVIGISFWLYKLLGKASSKNNSQDTKP